MNILEPPKQMKIVFEREYLQELYEFGKCKSKKYRFQPQVAKQYKKAVDFLRAAEVVEDLFPIKSLNYERLSGAKSGVESVRAGRQYRVEFTTKICNDGVKLITICSIQELSNHYS